MPSNPNCVPPPPSLSRWSGGLGTRKGRAGNRPAGAEACAPPGRARWGRDAETSLCLCRSLCSTGASPVGAERGDYCLLVQKPALHRGEPGGGEMLGAAVAGAEALAPPGRARWGRNAETIACWGRSLRSTGASPVGARRWEQPLLVQKPVLHRGEPGGGGTPSGLTSDSTRIASVEAELPQHLLHAWPAEGATSPSLAGASGWGRGVEISPGSTFSRRGRRRRGGHDASACGGGRAASRRPA